MGQSFALPLPVTSKYVERFGDRHFRAAVVSMQGWRTAMEDSHIVDLSHQYGLFGVFDGHSGSECSKQCSRMLSSRIAQTKLPIEDEQLQQIMLDIDKEFLEKTEEVSGSTATFCVVLPKDGEYHVQVGNVGDSRIVFCSEGTAKPLTIDHKPSLPQEEERIKAAGGFVSMDRVNGDLAVSRAMGDRPYKVKEVEVETKPKATKTKVEGASQVELQVIALPDVTHATLKPGEWLLVACDGIFEPESFTNDEVIRFLVDQMSKDDDLGTVLCALCTEALKRGSTDNMTAMLVQMTDGSSFGQPGQLIPGPYDAEMGKAKSSYFGFAQEFAGLSVGKTLELRYDLLQQKIAELQNKEAETIDFSSMDTAQLKEWLKLRGVAQLPKKRSLLLQQCKSENNQNKFYTEDDVERLTEELKWFKGGPASDLQGEERTAWFSTLVAEEELQAQVGSEDEAVGLDDLSPAELKQLVDLGFLKELNEEMEEMEADGSLEELQRGTPKTRKRKLAQKKQLKKSKKMKAGALQEKKGKKAKKMAEAAAEDVQGATSSTS